MTQINLYVFMEYLTTFLFHENITFNEYMTTVPVYRWILFLMFIYIFENIEYYTFKIIAIIIN